jgi:hypothetical protein
MIFDGLAIIQASIGYAISENALYVTAGMTYAVGPIGVHMYHGRVGNIVLGAGMRLLGPGLGAGTGFAIDKATSGGRSNGNTGAAVGIGIGCLTAAILDDVVNSHEMLQFWERTGQLVVAPTFTRDSRGFSLSGAF